MHDFKGILVNYLHFSRRLFGVTIHPITMSAYAHLNSALPSVNFALNNQEQMR